MKPELLKPIPKYILTRVKKLDLKLCPEQSGFVRFYAYLIRMEKELVKVTVAVKNRYKKWYCKQVALHGVHSDRCYVKDMCFYYIGGYVVGWHAEGLQKYSKWYEDDEWGWNADRLFDPYAPIINREFVAKFPEYRYSAYELYKGVDMLHYLRLYEQYPQIEYLIKLGLHRLHDSKTILRKIGSDKSFCKWLIKNKDELIAEYHYVSVILRAYRTGKPLKELQTYEKAKIKLQHDGNLKPIRELFKGKDLERFFSYIEKQNTNPHSYLDYLKACKYLNVDMTLNKNRFPHDFRRWHDIRIDEYATAKALADEKERKALYAEFETVAQKYLSLENRKRTDFAVFIAKSPGELIREGKALDHCVGRMNYDQKFVREESLIFFIRKSESPDVPFVTVEYSPKAKKVLQCYGKKDSNPDENVLQFVHKVWQPYANKMIKKLAA